MGKYEIVVHDRVFETIGKIQDFIASKYTYEAAEKYSEQLFDDIESLSDPLLVSSMQPSRWKSARRYHPAAKRLISKNRKWNIVFHTDGNFVVIDAIIPSSLIK